MKTIVHVNQHIIKSNRKNQERKAPLTVKTYLTNTYGHEVIVNGPCRIVYSPDKPLSCGGECWVETTSDVEVIVRDQPASLLPCPNPVSQENCP